jgi:hypothetical protein
VVLVNPAAVALGAFLGVVLLVAALLRVFW